MRPTRLRRGGRRRRRGSARGVLAMYSAFGTWPLFLDSSRPPCSPWRRWPAVAVAKVTAKVAVGAWRGLRLFLGRRRRAPWQPSPGRFDARFVGTGDGLQTADKDDDGAPGPPATGRRRAGARSYPLRLRVS